MADVRLKMKTNVTTRNGVIGRSYENGFPVIWRFVNEEPSESTRAALPWLTVISWEYDGAGDDGMPGSYLNERMIELEDAIQDNVLATGFCEHAISRTGNNLKEMSFYIHSRDSFMERLNLVLKSHDRYPIEIKFYNDPDWKEHANARASLGSVEGEPAEDGKASPAIS
jgi:hypothetical protein